MQNIYDYIYINLSLNVFMCVCGCWCVCVFYDMCNLLQLSYCNQKLLQSQIETDTVKTKLQANISKWIISLGEFICEGCYMDRYRLVICVCVCVDVVLKKVS